MAIEITNDTVVKILVRRGTDSERQLSTFTEGELAYCIDTQRVFVGDGVTPGGNIAGNKFLGSTNLKSNFTSIAQIGDTVYQVGGGSTEAEVLNAYVGGGLDPWLDIHPKPYKGTSSNEIASLEKANNGRWRVSSELIGTGLTLVYDDQEGITPNSLEQIRNRIDFDSRYACLSVFSDAFRPDGRATWYFGDYSLNQPQFTKSADATVNVENSFFINGTQLFTPYQLKMFATDPQSTDSSLIQSTLGNFNIKGQDRLSLMAENREGYRLSYNSGTDILTTTLSSHRNGTYSNPNFWFQGLTRFSNPVFYDFGADVTIFGNLSVLGETTYLDTTVTTTSALSVVNRNNNFDALYVAQLNNPGGSLPNQNIARFRDSTIGQSTLVIKEQGFVGINLYDNNLSIPSEIGYNQYFKTGPFTDNAFNFAVSGSCVFLPSISVPTSSKFRVHMGSGDIYLGVNNTGHILFDTGATNSTTYMTISGGLRVSDDVIAYAISDERVKDNVQPISNALEKLEQITGVSFDWKPESGHLGHDYGVIAQEIEKVLPEVVITRDSGYKAVKYEKIIPLLIEAIKELKGQIKCL
jgi:hypothetical protein